MPYSYDFKTLVTCKESTFFIASAIINGEEAGLMERFQDNFSFEVDHANLAIRVLGIKTMIDGLNEYERYVLKGAMENMEDAAGGDFGFSDEVKDYCERLKPAQVAGYLSALLQKNILSIDEEFGQTEVWFFQK